MSPRREEGVRGLHRRNRRTISGELWNLIGGGIEMRKVMLLAAVMAMILAAAAPVFAQANAVGGSVQYVDCDQIQAAATGQYNVENDQEALAALAQELGVDQNQVLACFESIAAGGDVNINTAEATVIADTATPKAGGRRRRLRFGCCGRRASLDGWCIADWRLARERCLWPVVFWSAGSFGN